MAILRNKTQGDFTIIQNNILKDHRTSIKGRGLFLTLCGLPDNWDFSEEGLAKTMKDGKDSIHSALKELEEQGYVRRYTGKNNRGRFDSIIEVFPEGNAPKNPEDGKRNDAEPEQKKGTGQAKHETSDVSKMEGFQDTKHEESIIPGENESGFTVTENPPREIRHGETAADKQPQYSTVNTINKSSNEIKECVKYTLGNQSLTSDDYDDLVREFGTELVEYQISRIISKPYRGMLRKEIIAKWCRETIENDNRKVSGGYYPGSQGKSSQSPGTRYDFDALNKFIRDN